MTESSQTPFQANTPDPDQVADAFWKVADQSRQVIAGFLEKQSTQLSDAGLASLGAAFMEMTARLMHDPQKLMEAQFNLWQDYVNLWQGTWLTVWNGPAEKAAAASDKRFKHEDWDQNVFFDFLKQSYLLSARWVQNTVGSVEGMDPHSAKKVEFYTRQFVDALSPTNFVLTNPEVLRATVESGGQNLLKGLQNLVDDLERGEGKLLIKMTDLKAFELGKNIATTPGKVVYQNDLMQLIQYTPSTKEVYKRPLLIIPPWINKFYILDLQEKNSLVKWCVDQGHTVFVISWANPDERHADKDFADYMREGPLAATDAIREITGEKDVNAIGYCLGGTLLMTTLAYLAAKKDKRIASGTCFTTLTDFGDPGELEVFIDEDQIRTLESKMQERGFLEGEEMSTTFNMLRANDLIWSFFVNNYLLGKDPFPFDLLYWNSDSTRMPAKMHGFYLRNMYQQNKLVQPGGVEIDGVPIDLRRIKTPLYFISAIEDHIAPWKSTYAGALLPEAEVKFVLGGSGHIAGIVNPPAKTKYCYWTNPSLPGQPDQWFAKAERHEGSWWPDWNDWVSAMSPEKTKPRDPAKNKKLPPIEDAPGSYVKVRSRPV